jgi:hypothetical protein
VSFFVSFPGTSLLSSWLITLKLRWSYVARHMETWTAWDRRWEFLSLVSRNELLIRFACFDHFVKEMLTKIMDNFD